MGGAVILMAVLTGIYGCVWNGYFNKLIELSNLRDDLVKQLDSKNERWLELLEKQEKSQSGSLK